ncbi:hypothetical protein M2119_000048 [Aurantimicrobium minutum]|uniref:hypothetical protein n=1 Tax=Aurantimicrobium minutum TaxID=708131 RepID=UPI002474B4CD|nr:hypothetical protein [Aurantimicrobium minutum]MDH6531811.1 hypothetical protein [Aurantimicrobium minutum]
MENDWIMLAWLSPLILVMVIFDLRARNYGKKVLQLPKKHYVSLLWLAILDPVFEVLFIGIVLWDDLTKDTWHWVAGAVGVVLGYFFARYRTRIMWVRPLPEKKAVVVRNSGAEYLALVFLLVVKTVSENTSFSNYFVSLFITVGLLMIVSESAFRVGMLFTRYNKEVAAHSASDQSASEHSASGDSVPASGEK